MALPKLVRLLRTLRPRDWKLIEKYVDQSFDKDSQITHLFYHFKSNSFFLEGTVVDPEFIQKKLYPSITKKQVQNLMSRLYEEVLQIITIDDFASSDRFEKAQVISLNNRGLYDLANKKLAKTEKQITKSGKQDWWQDLSMHELHHRIYFSDNPISYKDSSSLESSIQSLRRAKQNLFTFYKIEITNRVKILAEDWTDLLDNINEESPNSLQEILNALSKMIIDEDPLAYEAALTLFTERDMFYSEELNIVTCLLLARYLNNQIAKGQKELIDNLLSVFQVGLDKGYMLDKGKLSDIRYHNIINIACVNDRTDWARSFVDNYSNLIDKPLRSQSIDLGLAQIMFSEERFDDCLGVLVAKRFSNFSKLQRAKWLTLLCNYELNKDYPDFQYTVVDNYRRYVLRNKNKLSHVNYNGGLALAKIMKMMSDQRPLFELEDELKNHDYILKRSWVDQKLDEKRSTLK